MFSGLTYGIGIKEEKFLKNYHFSPSRKILGRFGVFSKTLKKNLSIP
jgi:hypothetical protein